MAAPPLDRRDTLALDGGVEHVGGDAQQPVNRIVAARREVPLQPRRRERLGGEVVRECWVADAPEEDTDEGGEPALGKRLEGARVGVGVGLTLDGSKSRCTAARVSIGAVAPTPLFVAEAGAAAY